MRTKTNVINKDEATSSRQAVYGKARAVCLEGRGYMIKRAVN
jgi:hypothetical protein